MISICMLTWARIDDSEAAVRSIYSTTNVPFELLILDQSPDNKIGKYLKGIFPEIKMHYSDTNRGVAAGRNFLFSQAKGDILFSIDDDSTVGPGVIDRIHQIMTDDPSMGVLACNVIHAGIEEFSPDDPGQYEVMIFNGQSSISRAAITATGGYPEHFFRENEEKHLAMKIADKGFSITFIPSIVVDHKQSPIDRDFAKRLHLQARNEMYMIFELAPYWLLLPLLTYKSTMYLVAGVRFRVPLSTTSGLFTALLRSPKILRMRSPLKTKTWLTGTKIKLRGGMRKI